MSASLSFSGQELPLPKSQEALTPFIPLEPLASETESIDFEQIFYQTLVNDGKHIRILNSKRPQFSYNEKQLRDAAAAEVALSNCTQGSTEGSETSTKKRKELSADEKVNYF